MKKLALFIGIMLMMSACGTATGQPGENQGEQDGAKEAENDAKIVSGREIIASLEQSTEDTSKRDEQAEKVKESDTYKDGYMGEPTEELAEDLAVQQIEGQVAAQAIEQVYGGYEGVNEAGVVFYENQQSGAEQSGFWFGVKEPDERIDELLAILQKKVDAGEILAEPFYIYQSPHTQKDLELLAYQASKKMRPMQEAHHNPEAAGYSVSADTITGALEIGHNFFTEEQQKEIIEAFPDHEVIIEQEGRMVPGPGEPDVLYPNPETAAEPSREGEYVMAVNEDSFMAVETEAQNFSATGGVSDFYSAIDFQFPEASDKLEVGQRVLIEPAGPIMESYPGQGTAVFVEVLPAYQPETADLSEIQVIQQAVAKADEREKGWKIISGLAFDEKADKWIVEMLIPDKEKFEIEIDDK